MLPKYLRVFDAECPGKRQQTRKGALLIGMDRVLSRKGVVALIAPYDLKGDGGGPAYPLLAMRRVQLVDNRFAWEREP